MMTARHNWFDVLNVLLLFGFALLMLFPVYHAFALSTSSGPGIATGNANYMPVDFNIHAYRMVMQNPELLGAYYNSVRYAVLGTVIYILATSLVAYPLTIRGFWLNKPATLVYVLTMFVSGGLIPTYLMYRALGLLDTIWVMVLPGAVTVFGVILFRTNFRALGSELREAAYMDGAGDFRVLFRIVMPLSKPIIATLALFRIVAIWNDFFTPFVFMNDERLRPLTVLLRRMLVTLEITDISRDRSLQDLLLEVERDPVPIQGFRAATIIVTILPIMCIYPFIQRYFVKGMMIGSLKQ